MANMRVLARTVGLVAIGIALVAGLNSFPTLGATSATIPAVDSVEFVTVSGVVYACEKTTNCKVLANRGSTITAGGEASTGRPASADLQSRTTVFHLEQNASLQVQDVNNAFSRLLLKAGRLFVAHDPQGHDVITVKAGTSRVEAVDTLFNIEVTDDIVHIAVPAGWGTVKVTLDSGASGLISGGQKMNIKAQAQILPSVEPLDADGQAAWDRVIDAWLDLPDLVPRFATRDFPQTGYTVSDHFLAYWNRYGQILPLGYPLGAPFVGPSVRNPQQQLLMQCFERGLFELHPEYTHDTYQVLEAHLGTARYETTYGAAGAPDQQANQTSGDSHYFATTGHWVGGRFWRYWQAHDGQRVLGYPISDEFTEASQTDPAQTHTVQYFERDLLEYHPEYAGTAFEVLAALLGRNYCQGGVLPTGTPTAGVPATATATPTSVALPTATAPPTETATAAPTNRPRATRPPAATATPRPPSASPTNTGTPTDTPSPTDTRTPLPTQTPGGPTATNTASPTNTPTASPTITPTAPPTNTPTPTPCVPAWSIVTSPNPGAAVSTLEGVSALAANDVWAAGFQNAGSGNEPLIEHWDGTAWTTVTSIDLTPDQGVFHAIDALSATDIWAVGERCSTCGSDQTTLLAHWDGTTWTAISSPSPGAAGSYLNGVVAVAANDVWAVGSFDNGGNSQTLILHWNGAAWMVISSPNGPGVDNALYGVAAVTSTDIWAVGNYTDVDQQTLTLHWNGAAWAFVSSPSTAGANNRLTGVASIATNDVWAVGYYDDGLNAYTTALHWTGATWLLVAPTPAPALRLNAVAARASNDVWAVGQNDTVTEIVHWNGTAWSAVTSPNPPGASTLIGVDIVSATNVWAVGNATTGTTKTLVEHYVCP